MSEIQISCKELDDIARELDGLVTRLERITSALHAPSVSPQTVSAAAGPFVREFMGRTLSDNYESIDERHKAAGAGMKRFADNMKQSASAFRECEQSLQGEFNRQERELGKDK